MKTLYLMTYRESGSRQRRDNLERVLATLAVDNTLSVLVIEQDTAPTLDATLLQGAQTFFVYNAGPFNKAWGLNVAARIAQSRHLIFADADMLLPAGMQPMVAALASGAEVVKPYTHLYDLSPEQTDALDDGILPDATTLATQPDDRRAQGENIVLCGGTFGINAASFARMGGWDERFLGWGGEDDALSMKIQRFRPSVVELDGVGLHLHHERSVASRYQHPHYNSNVALLDQYRSLDDASLGRLCEVQKQLVGNTAKYSPQVLTGAGQ